LTSLTHASYVVVQGIAAWTAKEPDVLESYHIQVKQTASPEIAVGTQVDTRGLR
jgi:hypothetical protein